MNKKRTRISLGNQVLIGLLTGAVAFAAITQARQRETDALSSLRQSELVRLLDELTLRTETLAEERNALQTELEDLESGVVSQTQALEAAQERIRGLSIQAGVTPVHGPGIEMTIVDDADGLTAQSFVSLVEELRNAGAEAIEVNDARIGTASWFTGEDGVVSLEGRILSAPYTVRAVGNPDAMSVALEMPGGILASFRQLGAQTEINELDDVTIASVRTLTPLSHAKVVE